MAEEVKQVKVWEETVEIPTYGIGKPDKNPMFLEKRVYQGSSGKVYPHPVVDKIEDEKKPAPYRMVYLENEYLQIAIMPEIGGRIYRALDKTNNYDFVYYNRVIKPALVGLAGPWISGGIEFNWPQHHRPNTYGPVDYRIAHNEDGSKTVWVSEIDRMYGTKGMAGFTLYPGKAYLEIHGQLYNRTSEPQTFLWWANPAVAVNQHTQSVFPPDVHAVFDHGKRDVSKFPIATGTYYKMDYSAGVDISRYKNIPVPTSYMAYKSDYNFVGGYDHSMEAGILHVANHHISPGKKQWTWGHSEFGQAWDRNLTDEDGPYIELMTGVYTDNQPDFTWLHPYEEKSFKQYFMPYKHIGVVKNANIDAAVNLEVDEKSGTAQLMAYATSIRENALVELKSAGKVYVKETVTLSPTDTFAVTVELEPGVAAHELQVAVYDREGRLLVDYKPREPQIERVPDPAKAIGAPEELKNTEALYLAGQHLEQYRHATFDPEDYYLEGLKRDPEDIRLNNAYGKLLMRRGLFLEAEGHFRKAIGTLNRHNTNPYDSEPHYNLGMSLIWQGRLEEAFSAFFKATWNAAYQDSGYFALAQIAAAQGRHEEALELAERSVMRNYKHYQARNLWTALLRLTGRLEQAERLALETARFDTADFGARNELVLIRKEKGEDASAQEAFQELAALMRDDIHNYMALAQDYADAGLYQNAAEVLGRIVESPDNEAYPMAHYLMGFLYGKLGEEKLAQAYGTAGRKSKPDYCFPNTLLELAVLERIAAIHPDDARARYYLGNLLYDKKRHQEAISLWEQSAALDPSFPTVHRNLALGYFNKRGQPELARAALEKAFDRNPADARVLFELDQLYKKLGVPHEKRLARLTEHFALVEQRDDLYVEFVTLQNLLERHEEALELILRRTFHPWEGGEGKITTQYVLSRVEIAKSLIAGGKLEEAAGHLREALVYPHSLGEGKLAGAQENHIYYYLGCALEGLGRTEEAKAAFETASVGLEEPSSAMFYNDQPPEMIYYQGLAHLKLGREGEAKRRFNKLVDYGETHIFDTVKIDYFAVSLPDFLVFDEDLNRKNEVHCRFMMGLGYMGLGLPAKSAEQLEEALRLDVNHFGVKLHLMQIAEA